MDNITSRLRHEAEVARSSAGVVIVSKGLLTEAADEIDRLEARPLGEQIKTPDPSSSARTGGAPV